jgi:choline dehydrogenase-like flavoprotein
MDHTTCVLGKFPPQEADPIRERFGHYWLDNSGGRNVYLQGLALSGEIQQRERLLNCHAYVEEYDPALDDPWSALRQLKSAISARLAIGRVCSDALTVLAHFGEVGLGFYRRLVKHRPELVRVNRLELHCMLEQVPDPESRITLSTDTTDPLGMPLSKIRWKMSELERHTARRMSQLVSKELRRLGLPAPLLTQFLDEDDWMAHFVERAHPAGSTRMSADAKQGVVDRNSQVHGIRGLFVSGSSVFPTSGAANPTLMIVAMALRLANRLKQTHFNSGTNS